MKKEGAPLPQDNSQIFKYYSRHPNKILILRTKAKEEHLKKDLIILKGRIHYQSKIRLSLTQLKKETLSN